MNQPAADAVDRFGRPRWDGQRGRVEVWYATFTAVDGTGYWIHHETVAPTDRREPYGHGWAAVFPPEGRPSLSRFGPAPVRPRVGGGSEGCWFRAGDVQLGPGRLAGTTDEISWELTFKDKRSPLFTFPRLAWDRELLPGAQIVPWPEANFTGTVSLRGRNSAVDAIGAMSRIYSHANPQSWCWLHLGLEPGVVVEAVSAVARRPGLRRLPPLTMLRLRRPGHPDWPPTTLGGLLRWRARTSPTGFTIAGSFAGDHLIIEVRLPAERCVTVAYTDPDGSTATCTNSERADAEVTWTGRSGQIRRWGLAGRAHAEIGTRP